MPTHRISDEDRAFREAFDACEIAPADFGHPAHLRLAYSWLAEHEAEEAVTAIREALHRFLDHNGVPREKYHETLTRSWVLAVRHFMNRGSTASAAEFLDTNPELLDSRIMLTHYSEGVLFSPEARAAWVEPDLDPIPRPGGRS
ncbi:MAG: hypothetical protein AB7G12_16415 [Thermoanaerobaculia bacterium]